jgi:hypothetical protein
VNSYVAVMKKVHVNMRPILDGHGVMTAFSFPYTSLCEPRLSSERPRYLDTSAVTKACGVGWVHNRVAACVAASGGIFENQL